MSKDWTPETLKEYLDAQFAMLQEEMDRRFVSQDRSFNGRAERVDALFDLVNIHLSRVDEALAQVQGSRTASNRLWTLLIAGAASLAAIAALIVFNLPHR